jgi:hypothetical protein
MPLHAWKNPPSVNWQPGQHQGQLLRTRRSRSILPHCPQRYVMTSLPSSRPIVSSFIVLTQTMQDTRDVRGLWSSFMGDQRLPEPSVPASQHSHRVTPAAPSMDRRSAECPDQSAIAMGDGPQQRMLRCGTATADSASGERVRTGADELTSQREFSQRNDSSSRILDHCPAGLSPTRVHSPWWIL